MKPFIHLTITIALAVIAGMTAANDMPIGIFIGSVAGIWAGVADGAYREEARKREERARRAGQARSFSRAEHMEQAAKYIQGRY